MTDFDRFVAPIVGLEVGAVWRGHGSAIFFEFGELGGSGGAEEPPGVGRAGAFTLMIEWSWRIEGERRILCGSFNDDHEIEEALYGCRGRRVEGVALFGRLPEIDVALSGGRRILSFMTAEGDPEWTIFDNRGPGKAWTHAADGELVVEREAGDRPMS